MKNTNGCIQQWSAWQHLPTKVIRVPNAFADKVRDYARQLDSTGSDAISLDKTSQDIQALVVKIKAKEKGYQPNSASRLVKDILAIAENIECNKVQG